MGIWCFLKLVIVYVLRYDFLDTFRLRVYKSKKSSFEQKIQAGKPGFFLVSRKPLAVLVVPKSF